MISMISYSRRVFVGLFAISFSIIPGAFAMKSVFLSTLQPWESHGYGGEQIASATSGTNPQRGAGETGGVRR